METIAVQSSLERWNDVDFAALPVLQLPLQKLCKLQQLELQLCYLLPAESASSTSLGSGSSAVLEAVYVEHTADSAARGLPAQLTALTKLSLDCCKVDLGDLSYCTSILHLDLTLLMVTDRDFTDLDGKVGVEGLIIKNILANLPQLRFLQLDALIVSEGMLQFSEFSSALDNLQQLQVLRLGSCIVTDEDSLNDIPVSLTQLSLRRPKNWWYGPTPSAVATPRLSQLSELQHLDSRNVYYFEPALLTSYPQLTHLTLKQAMYAEEGDLLALMSALQSLKHLQHMDLDGSLLHDMPHQEPYASLTLSSTLTHLDLRGCYYPRQEVHPVIFNPGQASMTSLLHLTLDLWWNEAGSSVAALEPIAQCCSALRLQQLILVSWSIADAVQGLDLLHSLTALTSLCLELVHMSDSSFRDLGRCQQLKDLAIKDATTTSAAGLVHLTQLTTLTRLEVTSLGKHNRFLLVSMLASSQVPSSSPSNIPQQLLSHLRQLNGLSAAYDWLRPWLL